MPRKPEIRTKKQALEAVASHLLSVISADLSALAEDMGHDLEKMTSAEVARLKWAIEDVSVKLHRLAGH